MVDIRRRLDNFVIFFFLLFLDFYKDLDFKILTRTYWSVNNVENKMYCYTSMSFIQNSEYWLQLGNKLFEEIKNVVTLNKIVCKRTISRLEISIAFGKDGLEKTFGKSSWNLVLVITNIISNHYEKINI